jgi:hypothetical protein
MQIVILSQVIKSLKAEPCDSAQNWFWNDRADLQVITQRSPVDKLHHNVQLLRVVEAADQWNNVRMTQLSQSIHFVHKLLFLKILRWDAHPFHSVDSPGWSVRDAVNVRKRPGADQIQFLDICRKHRLESLEKLLAVVAVSKIRGIGSLSGIDGERRLAPATGNIADRKSVV